MDIILGLLILVPLVFVTGAIIFSVLAGVLGVLTVEPIICLNCGVSQNDHGGRCNLADVERHRKEV